MSKRYAEPLNITGIGMFEDSLRKPKADAAYEQFRGICNLGQGLIETAFQRQLEAARLPFDKIWVDYSGGRDAEQRAVRAAQKRKFKALGALATALAEQLSNPDQAFRPYLIQSLARQLSFAQTQQAHQYIDKIAGELEIIVQACRAEVKLQHRTGSRRDETLIRACDAMRQLILSHTEVRIPMSLGIFKGGSFENREVATLFQFMRCIDEQLTPSQIQSALKQLGKFRVT